MLYEPNIWFKLHCRFLMLQAHCLAKWEFLIPVLVFSCQRTPKDLECWSTVVSHTKPTRGPGMPGKSHLELNSLVLKLSNNSELRLRGPLHSKHGF